MKTAQRSPFLCSWTPYEEDSIMKPTKHCLKRGEGARENKNIMEEVNLFKIHSTHVYLL
jgi:hypothetical protein